MNISPKHIFRIVVAVVLSILAHGVTGAEKIDREIAEAVRAVTPKVVAWRRDIHQHPELGNREFRTAGVVADHLRSLGMEVQTGVAHTGVVGVLRGGKPGAVVALRADMDALPVEERVDIPFASKVKTTYKGREVGVMHACGHDVHTAMLMGAAEVLAGLRENLPGTVKFIFQPAEEGPPPGEDGGASLMIAEGVLENPAPQAIFGLHTSPAPPGTLAYRAGGVMAGSDSMKIIIKGRQTHGALPWAGVDPIVVASQVVLALQLIPSRQMDLIRSPTVISIGSIHGGVRHNIVPDEVVMEGTIRILDPAAREDVLTRIENTVSSIAESAGAEASVTIKTYSPVTYNDPELMAQMLPSLQRVAGQGLVETTPVTPSEDYAFYQQQIPGLYLFIGVNKAGVGAHEAAANHSPYFYVNEDVFPLGVRTLATLAVDYLEQSR